MKWAVSIISVLVSSLWGLYGGFPGIPPFKPRELLIATSTSTETGDIVNKTACEIPTVPLHQANPNATVDPTLLPKIGNCTINNLIDRFFNSVRSRIADSRPHPSSVPYSEPVSDSTYTSPSSGYQLSNMPTWISIPIVVALLVILVYVPIRQTCLQSDIKMAQQSLRKEIIYAIGTQSREINDIRIGLGHMYGPIASAQEELQKLRRDFRNVERLSQDLVRFTKNEQKRQFSSEDTSEAACSERERLWEKAWTDIKEEVRRTAEGFRDDMTVFVDLHRVLTKIAEDFQGQYQRSTVALADELATAFVSQLRSQGVGIQVQTMQHIPEDEESESGSHDKVDLMNFDDPE